MDIENRLAHLREELTKHSRYYYAYGAPEITDEAYDQMFKELVELETKHPEFDSPTSPTKRIGSAEANTFQKVAHAKKMLSLDNAFSAKEVMAFFKDEKVLHLEPKIDGLSLKLFYVQGVLECAVTRGDGSTGDDVTANARTIKSIPLVLAKPVDIEVTGEVYMTYAVFNALNEAMVAAGDPPFANARNAASGTLKLKDPQEVAQRSLSFVAHGGPNETAGIKRHLALITYLSELGFQTVYTLPENSPVPTVGPEENMVVPRVITLSTEEALAKEIEWADYRRKNLDLATDGLVFKVNDLAKQRELGEGTRSPKWAVAYKFPPERKSTTLLSVVLQVGKTGRITPVAELSPVSLSGSIVKRASLCNQDEIARLGVGIGDEVWIEKSAEIIPKIVGIAKASPNKPPPGYFILPSTCPCCKQPLVRPEGFVDFCCENADCEDQVIERLVHATGKGALDIDGCGQVLVESLVKAGVRKLSDLFAISDLSFIKPSARKKFLAGRELAKKAPFWRKLTALCIEGVGQSLCKDMAARWTSLNAILDTFPETGTAMSESVELKKVLGKVNYATFTAYLLAQADELERLETLGFKFEAEQQTIGPLTGKVFVVTGTMMSGTRDSVHRKIEEAGGSFKNAVTKKVHYLVSGPDGGAAKPAAAQKHGVAIISEEQLYEMMGAEMKMRSSPIDPNHEY